MELTQAKSLALVLMTKHGLMKHGYQFQWDNRSRRFGAHQGRTRIIFLSRRLTLLNDEPEVKDTILHEIAHALDFIRNGFQYRYAPSAGYRRGKRLVHDDVWKAICVEIGCKPRRCYTDEEVVSPKRNSSIQYRLINRETGEVVKSYKKRPKDRDWSKVWIKGKKQETFGKLALVPVNL